MPTQQVHSQSCAARSVGGSHMLIVVASGNIFRREFSSYILSEAGYEVDEARSSQDLIAALHARPPALIVLDQQIDGADPAVTLRAVRLLSEAPIIWITGQEALRSLLMADQRPAELISWPFRGADLVAITATLLGRASADLVEPSLRERYAGSAE